MIEVIDNKGDRWQLVWTNADRYLHNGHAYYKAWWYAPTRPYEFRNFDEVPIPIFTDWWDDWA